VIHPLIGDPECPARGEEGLMQYLRRLAIHLGYKVEDAPERRGMPNVEVSYEQRLREIWEPNREPGDEG
jgi:hypothetical protein